MNQGELNLAIEHHRAGRWHEAEDIYRRALSVNPNIPEIIYNLGTALKSQRKYPEAIAAFRRALKLRSQFPPCLNNLANALRESHQPVEAIDIYRQALSQRPDFPEVWNNLGMAMKDTGQLHEALECFERAIELQPENSTAYSNRLGTMHFHSDYDAAAIGDAARAWAAKFAPTPKPFNFDRPLNERRLRVGYVSPYFRCHCQSLFTTPLFSNHDHDAFEIFCYSDATNPDAITTRLRPFADNWREISGKSDDQVTTLVHDDQIDILIDLTLHMAGHRLGVFAQKPAQIQITWLGYPGTTGLNAIDYRLTDPRLNPPGRGDEFYSERSWRLPDTFWCYDPRGMDLAPDADPPMPNPLPALTTGQITFGCLNNFCKVTDATLALWSGVFQSIPNSRLILLAPPGPHRDRVIDRLGISADRVQFAEFQQRRDYLLQYHSIDLSLDTIPYNGHTTSLDSLWMGVPVLSRVGQTVVGRAGQSQLHHLGLSDLAASSDEQFIQLAVQWASDLQSLSALRSQLRERMQQSPLMDSKRFAKSIESAYREIWLEKYAKPG